MSQSDNYWLNTRTPALTYGLRGIAYFAIHVSGPGQDLHSGLFGGMVHEPMTDLVKLMSKLVDHNGRILIPGIEAMVAPPDEHETWVLCVLSAFWIMNASFLANCTPRWTIPSRTSQRQLVHRCDISRFSETPEGRTHRSSDRTVGSQRNCDHGPHAQSGALPPWHRRCLLRTGLQVRHSCQSSRQI